MKRFPVFILLFCLTTLPRASAHSEMAGKVTLEHHQGTLYAEVILDKRMLTTALMHEGDCPPADMLKVCGAQYFQKHVALKINHEETQWTEPSYEIQQKNIVFRYELKAPGAIQNIAIISDYMLAYNDHAILRAALQIGDKTRSFDLKAHRQSVSAKFN